MNKHTLILSTAKVTIPIVITMDMVTSLINRGLTGVEYFGIEIDYQADYLDDDMIEVSEGITYMEFYFDTEETIDYDSLTVEETNALILDVIKKSDQIEIRADEKDVAFYL